MIAVNVVQMGIRNNNLLTKKLMLSPQLEMGEKGATLGLFLLAGNANASLTSTPSLFYTSLGRQSGAVPTPFRTSIARLLFLLHALHRFGRA